MVYYLGSDGDAPLTAPWVKEAPVFYVAELSGSVRDQIMRKLPHKHLVYLGSHEGCGCGFRRFRNSFMTESEVEDQDVIADHEALAAYLRSLPSSERPIQIFGCWTSDESDPIEFRREIAPSDLLDPEFGFREREILTLKP